MSKLHNIAVALAVILVTALSPIAPVSADDQPLGPVSRIAELDAREITNLLHRSAPGARPDLSGKFLAYLDLSDLDFKGANLARSDFYGTDLTGANLSGTDLSQTRLDRSVLIRANLSGAKLVGATIYRPTIYADIGSNPADAPRFSGADLTGVHVQAELSGADFRGADLSNASFYPLEARPGSGTLTTAYKNILKYCDFSGARLRNADFRHALLWFARFTGADLTGANLSTPDLSRADFSGADVTGVDFSEADLDGATLAGARGLDQAIGLDRAINLDRAIR